MNYSSTALRRCVAAVTISAFMFALSACNSGNGSSFELGGAKSAGGPILSQGYDWYTVDNPLGTTNQITGINDTFQVVGNYTSATQTCSYSTGFKGTSCADCPLVAGGSSQNGNTWFSYTSSAITGFSSFAPVQYAKGKSQYLYGISDVIGGRPSVEVGCLIDPGGGGGGLDETWGADYNSGLWSALRTPSSYMSSKGATCNANAIGEALGIGTSGTTSGNRPGTYQVGFKNVYLTTNNCPFEPWIIPAGDNSSYGVGVTFSNWGSGGGTLSTEATGIDPHATYVVGSAALYKTSQDVPLRGWYVPFTQIGPTSCGGCNIETTAYSYKSTNDSTSFSGVTVVGTEPKIVGWYSASGQTHGFVLTITASGPSWSSAIDAPSSNNYTVISGINSAGDICGWYKDSNGKTHGFVGLVEAVQGNQKPHHSTIGSRT